MPTEEAALAPLPVADDRAIFEEPWQASVLAMAAVLVENGAFSAGEWSAALGAELEKAAATEAPDTQTTYYTAALNALENLLAERGGIGAALRQERVGQWRRAYLNTPHGAPVKLAAGNQRTRHYHHSAGDDRKRPAG